MSYLWSFYSFSPERFNQVFGGASPTHEESLVQSVTWDGSGLADAPLAEQLARSVVRDGISYENLSNDEAQTLDGIIHLSFTQEGLGGVLEVEPESSDGLHPSVVEEMLEKGGESLQLKLLPILLQGQRFEHRGETARCEYCILEGETIQQLLDESKAVMEATTAWSEEYMPEVIDECLIAVLEGVIKKKKALVGLLG